MDLDIEHKLQEFEAAERARLGLDGRTEHWRDTMADPFFSASQRPTTTLLIGGLTMAHDKLAEGTLRGLGYNVRALDCPDLDSLRHGREYGNKAQCNPTHFTVGNLVKELCRLRDKEGLSARQIIDNYLFMTAGACGPCRFGMYATEYRKALRDAGFDGFRVILFQHAGNWSQATGEELGLKLDPAFFFALLKALIAGDVLNLLSYRIRPYEVEAGATDRAVEEAKNIIHATLSAQRNILPALYKAGKVLRAVEVDRAQPKAKVSILGEFWAMTTEGDGNYHLQRFIEQEGGECEIQIIANLILLSLWEVRRDTQVRMDLQGVDGGKYGLAESEDPVFTLAVLHLAELGVHLFFQTFARLVGLRGHHLPDMREIERVGDGHYNVDLRGGEGHLEVGKLILNVLKNKAHMTVSVKPFGCMPSSGVSDGVQSAVTELLPDAIFCAVETAGDGAVNFYSRVQMFLFKARQRALDEFQRALDQQGVSQEQVRAFLRQTSYGKAGYRAPHWAAGTGASLVHHVGPLIGKGPLGRAGVHLRRQAESLRDFATKTLPIWGERVREAAPYMPALVRKGYESASSSVPQVNAILERVVETAGRIASQRAEASAAAPAEPKLVQLQSRPAREQATAVA
jgi:predicted nucleotide-binding protein (sugar kinase/HSP70/actin superfamily)